VNVRNAVAGLSVNCGNVASQIILHRASLTAIQCTSDSERSLHMVEVSLPIRLSALVMATIFLNNARALELATYQVVDLAYGVNLVDFGPIGTRGTVVLGWRENFNAQGFGVATFYLTGPKGQTRGFQTDPMLGLVTVWDDVKNSKEALTVATSGGADCVLHDFSPTDLKPAQTVTIGVG
jgi:hypothetical protein